MDPTKTGSFFDLAPEPLAVIGADGVLLEANAAFCNVLGRSGSDLVRETAVGFVHPEDLGSWSAGMRCVQSAAGPLAVCVRCKAGNGEWRWLEWNCSAAPNGRTFAVVRDVTFLRADARRLSQLESQMDAATAEVWLLDCEGRVVHTNAYLSTVLDVLECDMIGKRREDLKVGLDSPEECFAETLRVVKSGMPVWRSMERWGREGDWRWASVDKVPLRAEDDAVTNVVVFAYEVTSQVAAELEFRRLNAELEHRVALRTDELGAANSALRASEERTRAILANAIDAVVMMNRQGLVTGWNAAAERIFGWTVEEAMSREVAALIIPQEGRAPHRMGLAAARDAETGPIVGRLIEVTAVRKSGERFPVELSITGVGSGDGIEFTAFIRDISERKESQNRILDLNRQLERRVEEAGAANRELEAFCYAVSHDLRTPLRSIDGFSLALIEDYGDRLDATGRDYMGRVRGATQRMARLIDDLLNLSRVSRTEMTRDTADLSALATSIAADIRERDPSRKCVFEIQPAMVVDGDPALLGIVLENLLNNAWKYSSGREEARIEVASEERSGRRIFHVKDNGAGFDMAYVDKLFAPFQRLHRPDEFEGSGVGLATVQRILHRHGGHAWAEAVVDQGATIFFTL